MQDDADTIALTPKGLILRYLLARPGKGAKTSTLKDVSGLPLSRDVHRLLDELEADGFIIWVPRRGPVAVQHGQANY